MCIFWALGFSLRPPNPDPIGLSSFGGAVHVAQNPNHNALNLVQARAVLFRLEKKDKSPATLQHAGGFVCCSQLPLPISIAHFEI